MYQSGDGKHTFYVTASGSADSAISWTTAMTIDNSGNVLVGKTTTNGGVAGCELRSVGYGLFTNSGSPSLQVRRLSDDGDLVYFYKDTAQVGSIGSEGGDSLYIQSATTGGTGLHFHASTAAITPLRNGARIDNVIDLGTASNRFDDIYATNDAIQTSDRNEKQDIEELTDAETRVAVVAKGLMRKFRWKSAVAEKGDDARTHFGIIAQDLQDAFTAESLDVSDYAMFCSDTWWEKEISVDAVEAVAEVTDEEGNVTTEAVEAKDAYTYMDSKDEATEGYTEKTRLGVRYSELLAFIISAI
jgi:hypothetical protein